MNDEKNVVDYYKMWVSEMKKNVANYKFGGQFHYNPLFGNEVFDPIKYMVESISNEKKDNSKKIVSNTKGFVYKKNSA